MTELPDEIQVRAHGAVWVVTLTRPEERNAVNAAMRRAADCSLAASLGDAQQAVLWVGASADAREGKAAFLEKRTPCFRGQ